MANNGTKDSDYVVGLDIGTSKVVCIIGKYVDQHSLEVISMGSYPSSGLKKGVVVNIDATTDAIQKSIDQAQASFEGKIKNVYVGIAGNHIRSLNSHGIVGIKDKESSCILLYKTQLSPIAYSRLKILKETDDGFKIAEGDLILRGPGEILGSKQSGNIDFKFVDLYF